MEITYINTIIKNKDYESLKSFQFKDDETNIHILNIVKRKIGTDDELAFLLLSLQNLNINMPIQKKMHLLQRNDWIGFFETTIIGQAIKHDNIKILEKLKELKADFSYSSKVNYNYLTFAIEKNSIKSVNFLIDHFPLLIIQETTNRANNIFDIVSNKNMIPFIETVIKKTNYDLNHVTNYNATILDESLTSESKQSFNTVLSLFDDNSIAQHMSKNNYKLLWKCLYKNIDTTSLKKITDILSKKINLEKIINKENNLNFYEMCICYVNNNILKQYDFQVGDNFTKKISSLDNIKQLCLSSLYGELNIKNLDNNLLYIIKNNLINVDLDKNFKFNPYAVGLIKTGNYFYQNDLKFKNIKTNDLIKMVFASFDESINSYNTLSQFINLVDSKKKLNEQNSHFILNNAQYGFDNKTNKKPFTQYSKSVIDLIYNNYLSGATKIRDSNFFDNVFLISKIDDNYLDNKSSYAWQGLLQKGFESDMLNTAILCESFKNTIYRVSIPSQAEQFLINQLEKAPIKFFNSDLTEHKKSDGLIKTIYLLSQNKWKQFIENEKNCLLNSLEKQMETINNADKKRRI